MAAAVAERLPVAVHEQQALDVSPEKPGQQQDKTLRFQDKPWSNTQRVSLLTGAERDTSIAQDISQLIGNVDSSPKLIKHPVGQDAVQDKAPFPRETFRCPLLPMQHKTTFEKALLPIHLWCRYHRAGHTPLLELHSLTSTGQGRIVAKLEGFNPQSSVKDR